MCINVQVDWTLTSPKTTFYMKRDRQMDGRTKQKVDHKKISENENSIKGTFRSYRKLINNLCKLYFIVV